jgi:flagellar hook-length control protein FliK
MNQSYCEVKNRQILPPDCMRCRVPGAAIVHKTLNEQRNLARASWPDDCTEPAGTSGGATVVQVASDPTIHVQSHSPLRHPRSAQADHAPSPFESLLDDSAPAADRSPPPPTDDKASRADGSQPVRTSANSHDSKAPPAHDDDVATKPQDDANVDEIQSEESAVECKVGANAKVIHCASASDDGKSTGDGKPAENKENDNLAPALPVESVETNIKVDAIAAVPTPAPEPDQGQVPQLPEQAAPAAQLATQLKPLDPELVKDVVGKPAKVETQGEPDKKASANEQLETGQTSDQPVDMPEAALRASPAPQDSGKARHPTEDSDSPHIAQARGELPVSGHSHDDMPAPPADNLASQRGVADASTPLMASTQTHAASNAARSAPPVSQPDPQTAAIPVAGLAIEIAGKALAGKNRFEIRLDPPELGRIDVRLDVDRDGNVTSRLTVERAETYDLLRRDAAGLERALQDAGLKTTDNGLQFSLRDQSLNQQQANRNPDAAQLVVQDETQPIDVIPQNYSRPAGAGGGLDIRV